MQTNNKPGTTLIYIYIYIYIENYGGYARREGPSGRSVGRSVSQLEVSQSVSQFVEITAAAVLLLSL